eukprot:2785262-Amphidinium_carterae.2
MFRGYTGICFRHMSKSLHALGKIVHELSPSHSITVSHISKATPLNIRVWYDVKLSTLALVCIFGRQPFASRILFIVLARASKWGGTFLSKMTSYPQKISK